MRRGSSKNAVRTAAKIIGIVAVSLCVGAVVTIMLERAIFACFLGLTSGREEEKYVITRLSAESNPRGNEENYIVRQRNKIFEYSLKTEKLAEYDINVPEGERITCDTVAGSQVCYVLSNHIIRRFDCEKQTDEEVLSEEDLKSICGFEHWPESGSLFITRSEEVLLFTIRDRDFICPINGDLKTECIGVNTLFPEEDKTGEEQVTQYRGIRIGRHYDLKKEKYQITGIWEEKSGRALFTSGQRYAIKAGETQVILDHTRGYCDYSYQVEGTLKEWIRCLNVPAYEYAHIQGNKLTTENEDVIGLVHVPRESHYDMRDPEQDKLKYDALFRLNPKTGENRIFYRTQNQHTRIIGYQDGVIYLLRDFKIYSRAVENEEEKQIAELPKDTYYEFDWQGDYLIVINQDGIYRAYKVR